MVTCWDHTTVVAEDGGAVVREVRNIAWFHCSPHCQSSQQAVIAVSIDNGCPDPHLPSGPTTSSWSSLKPESEQLSTACQKLACRYPPELVSRARCNEVCIRNWADSNWWPQTPKRRPKSCGLAVWYKALTLSGVLRGGPWTSLQHPFHGSCA